jgi:hypothetical protein
MESTESPQTKTIQGKSKDSQETQRIPINIALKAKYAAYTTLIFFLIANPETYKLLQKFIGSWVTVASEGGCPTPTGFFLHTGLFFLLLWSFMLFPRDY